MARRTPGPVVSPENPVIPAHELERRYVATAESLRGRSFDVIVVGAGACGCTFAARLCAEAAPGTSVLLLEAGGEAQNSSAVRVPNAAMGLWRSEVDWGFRSEPQPGLLPRGRCMELEQGKTLGGSSAINYLVWVRGQRADFERWERTHGCAGWGYDGVREHFAHVERALTALAPAACGPPQQDGQQRFAAGHVVSQALPEALAFVASAGACGMAAVADYNRPGRQAGAALAQSSAATHSAQRLDAFNAFVEPVLARQRQQRRVATHSGCGQLTVCSCALALKVLFGDDGDDDDDDGGGAGAVPGGSSPPPLSPPPPKLPRARGVSLELLDGSVLELRARREVALACGALGTPQLLLLSGVGEPQQLHRHGIRCVAAVPAVGEGLQDHGVCPVQLRLRERLPLLGGSNGIPGIAFFRSAVDAARARAARAARGGCAGRGGGGGGDAGGGGDDEAAEGESDVQLVMTSRVCAGAAVKGTVQQLERSVPRLKQRGAPWEARYAAAVAAGRAARAASEAGDGRSDAASIDTVLNRPQSRGRVALRDADPHSAPLVDGRWLSHPDDVETQLCGLRKIRDVLLAEAKAGEGAGEGALPFGALVAEVTSPAGFLGATDDELRAHVRRQQQSTWHYSCTARMGDTARADVVCDPSGRVKGTRALRVVDCSLMPAVVAGNTNATALMMGDKLGRTCARQLRATAAAGGHARL